MDRIIEEVIRQSKKSSFKVRLGAVVVQKNKIIGKGFNIAHSTGKLTDGRHAEIAALNDTEAGLREGSTVYVGRLNKAGSLMLAKPCNRCEKVMRKMGVKYVWYSDQDSWTRMKL